MNVQEKYMRRCLELAQKGFGRVAPNPMVGCVIVHEEKVIGDGFHEKYGSAHAEVNAINSVRNKNLLKRSTLYVNLEPCSHFGKTSPCVDLIMRSGIKYVVLGIMDPNPVVKGRGIQKLASNGCDVKIGILEKECRELNKRFFTFHERKRPYIILKWAETTDGFIGISGFSGKKYGARHATDRLQITGSKANTLAHQWRSEEQAILVGTNTALTDNPKLTVRKVIGKNPLRIGIDNSLKIPYSYHLLDGSVPTLVFTAMKKYSKRNLEYVRINFRQDVLTQIMSELHGRQIQSLIVEGGAKLLSSFLEKNLWDETRVFRSDKTLFQIIGNKMNEVTAPKVKRENIRCEKINEDTLLVFRNTFLFS